MATVLEIVIEELNLSEEVILSVSNVTIDSISFSDSIEDVNITTIREIISFNDIIEDNVLFEDTASETLLFSDVIEDFIPVTEIVEIVSFTDTITDVITNNELSVITENINFSDTVQDFVTNEVIEIIEFQSEVVETQVTTTEETVLFSDIIQESINNIVVEKLNLNDIISSAVVDTTTETLNLSDIVNSNSVVAEEISESLNLQDEIESFRTVYETVIEGLNTNDEIEFIIASPFVDIVVETLELRDSIYSKDLQAIAWVVNTETGAPSYFENFGFDSIVEHNGELIAASIEGLFIIESTPSNKDYDGVDVSSLVQSGLIDWGTDQRKRIRDLYLGYTGDHHVLTVETSDPEGKQYQYELEAREAETIRNNRVRVGRGLNSRYWRFTLENSASGNSEITNMTANVDISKRRL